MSEQTPQPNPEINYTTKYLIPLPDGRLCLGFVTGEREEFFVSKQKNGPPVTSKQVEIQCDVINENGELITQKMMVADYLLSDAVQEEIRLRHLKEGKQDD